jgi:thioredoxin-disulfide reductase/thioredoxin
MGFLSIMARFSTKILVSIMVGIIILGTVHFYKQLDANPEFDLSLINNYRKLVPVAIIGSGPAGLGAGVYAARAGLHTVILEGSKPGGLLMGTTDVENWPGEKLILGPDLITKLRAQNQAIGVKFMTATVEKVDLSKWPYEITTTDKLKINALTIIIATGATPKTLGVPGEQEYWGNSVSACAICDAPYFKDLNVVVVGGGDSAIEEALQLAAFAKQVTIIVRGDKLRASVRMHARVQALPGKIKIIYNSKIQKITGNGKEVTSVELVTKDLITNKSQVTQMSTDGVFLAIGYDPNTKLFVGQLELDQAGYIKVQGRTQATSKPGVFAAGEVSDSYYRQAGIACAEGNKAALDADRFLQSIGFNSELAKQNLARYFQPKNTKSNLVSSISTLDELEREVVQSKIPVILDFWAPHCSACNQMLPNFEDLAEQFAGKIKFIKINTDDSENLVRKFYVLRIPTFVICRAGKVVKQFTGFKDKKELAEILEQFAG